MEDTVPVSRVFSRLSSALHGPSVEDVQQALDAMQLAAAAHEGAPSPAAHLGVPSPTDDVTLPADGPPTDSGPFVGPGRDGPTVAADTGPLVSPGDEGSAGLTVQNGDLSSGRQVFVAASGTVGPLSQAALTPSLAGLTEPGQPIGHEALLGAHAGAAASSYDGVAAAINGDAPPTIDDLFTTPAPPLVHCPPVRAPRQRCVFDMSAVRRSARLAAKPAVPSMQRAQNNLLRKLGLQVKEHTPIQEVLWEYVKSIAGPLPDYVIAALATLLDLDDDDKDTMTEALLQHAGAGIAELQDEQEALLVRDD
ncbi:unnamed protein product [Urochloa humidicola]